MSLIGNLLAEITGEKNPEPIPNNSVKRKPTGGDADFISDAEPKRPKTGDRNLPRPLTPAQKAIPSSIEKIAPNSQLHPSLPKPRVKDDEKIKDNANIPGNSPLDANGYNGTAARALNSSQKPVRTAPLRANMAPKIAQRHESRGQVAPHTTNTPLAPTKVTKPPKKGSYAEIMERAKRAQEVMAQPGNKVVKPLTNKPIASGKKLPAGVNKALPQKDKAEGKAAPLPRKTQPTKRPALGQEKKPLNKNEAPPKPRAPPPTFDYNGTARPAKPATAPNPNIKKRAGSGGVLLRAPTAQIQRAANRNANRVGKREYDDEEDDMDDFIDDDEEGDMDDFIEDDGDDMPKGFRRRYQYREYSDEEDDSDMEAGVDEIESEEQLAERLAKEADIKEQLDEMRRKQEKERLKKLGQRR